MAKPPKTTKPGSNTDTSRPSGGDTRDRGESSTHVPRPLPDIERPSGPDTSAPAGDASGTAPHRPVVITEMPTATSNLADATRMISWPREQVDQLFRIDNTGLFMDNQDNLYADLGAEGIFRVETNANDQFQVPLPFAPGQSGPILKKVPGQPHWQIANPGQINPVVPPAAPAPFEVIAAHLADKLTKPDSNGLRFDKLKRAYVDLADGGTVLVRKNAQGDFQACSNNEATLSGPVLEIIEGMTLWQRKLPDAIPEPEDAGPGPSKRPRLQEDLDTPGQDADTDITASNPYLWASWGKTSKPVSGESIQIGQLFYRILPKGSLTGHFPLAFLEHPNFAPGRFEPFERMLQELPSLQPVIALRSTPQVASSAIRPFSKPLTDHVGDVFKSFTPNTSRAVAKRLFEVSSGSLDIDGSGMARMMQALRHWEGKSSISVKGMGDPMDLLPVAAGSAEPARRVQLHPPGSNRPLEQLNLSPEASPTWNLFKDQLDAPGRISLLLSSLLSQSNYKVFLPSGEGLGLNPQTLVFKRDNHQKVYFLKIGYLTTDTLEIYHPTLPELADPMLHRRIGADGHQALLAADARGDVVWLIGGVQHLPGADPTVFIIKER